MKISVELSYYPFVNIVEEEVGKFLVKLKNYEGLTIKTNFMSTHIIGEYEKVMELLNKELADTFNSRKSVFVMKISNGCDESCNI